MTQPLDSFFNPKSVAMVGATEAAQKIAGRRWKTLVEGGFEGPLYPIHPRAAAVRGHRAYRTLRDVPGPVELAVVVVPSDAVDGVARDCIELGVGAVVLISGGFAESGGDGWEREARLVAQMREAGTRLVGPNCAGIASMPAKMNITGFDIPIGRVGLISQSGNLALNFSFLANRMGGGFSRQVTIGNAADLGVAELTEYLLQDPETDVILIYLEGWRDGEGRQLLDVVAAAGNRKPIVMLNPGGTETGRRAALSHTGALAATHRIAAGAYRQAGIVQVHDIESAWLVARSLCDLPPLASGSLAVLSDGGGHATLLCDALDRAGLRVSPFGNGTRRALARQLPARCAVDNPVDFAGVAETEPTEIAPVLETCLADPGIGGVVLVGHFGGYHTIGGEAVLPMEEAAAASFVESMNSHRKPLLVHSVHGRRDVPPLERLRDGGVPVTDSIPVLAAVASALQKAATGRRRTKRDPISFNVDEDAFSAVLEKAAPGPPRWLMEPEARALLQLSGFEVPEYATVATEDECVVAVQSFGTPVVMKLIAPDIVHKSRGGGVELNVPDAVSARAAFDRLTANGPQDARVLVAPMISAGLEMVIGGVRDRQFGPVVMAGLGGTAIEALDDVTFRPAPIHREEALEMFGALRARKLLKGKIGNAPPGLNAFAALLEGVSVLLAVRPEIAEIDLNPVFLHNDGPAIADARIVLT